MERDKPFVRRDRNRGHFVEGRVFIELGKDFTLGSGKPDERLTPDQMADLVMRRRGQGSKPPKYD